MRLREFWATTSSATSTRASLGELGLGKDARYRAVLLFGLPGSGKGTQGKALGGLPGFIHISTGEIFRQLSSLGVQGRQVAALISDGKLVPDELAVQIWRTHVSLLEKSGVFNPAKQIIILDGIPRTSEQAKILEEDIDVLRVFYLQLRSDDEALARIKERAIKENRLDDAHEDIVRQRLHTFYKNTESTLRYYPDSIIRSIEASAPALQVLYSLAGELIACEAERKGEAQQSG